MSNHSFRPYCGFELTQLFLHDAMIKFAIYVIKDSNKPKDS